MIILLFLAAIPLVFLYCLYVKSITKFCYDKTNGSDFGMFCAIVLAVAPLFLLIQILVWAGVLH